MPSSIEKIMEITGVSRATAYRALSGSLSVSENTRKRVARAAEGLEDLPTRRRQAVPRVGMWLCPVGRVVGMPDHASITRAIEDAAARRGVSLEVIGEPIPEDPEECADVIRRHRVTGVLLLNFFSQKHREVIVRHCPAVLFFERGDREAITDIAPDDFRAGYMATWELINRGHRRIAAVVGGGRRAAGFSQRFAGGYVRACAEAGIPVDESLILKNSANLTALSHDDDSLPPAGDDILRLKPRPTGVIGKRLSVIGVMHRLSREGLSVPDDMSVVAYGPRGWNLFGPPGLTQVQHDPSQMAELAFDALSHPMTAPRSLTVSVELAPGDSITDLKK